MNYFIETVDGKLFAFDERGEWMFGVMKGDSLGLVKRAFEEE